MKWIGAAVAIGVAFMLGALCGRVHEAESDHLAPQNGQCDRLEWDHDWNCVIGAGDLGHVAAHCGEKAPTWTATPAETTALPITTSSPAPTGTAVSSVTSTTEASATPSAIPTATSTQTPTPTPITLTPSPPSNLTLIETVIRDSDGQTPHDVIPCVPASYDWGRTSAVQGVGPAGYNAGDAWGVFQPLGCTSAQGIQVSIRNVRGYAYDGGWHLVNTGSAWCAAMDYTTATIMGSCSGGIGPNWTMPPQSLHWAGPIAAIPSGTSCALMHFEARASGGVLAGGGWDWRRTSNPGDIRAGGVGRYHLIGPEWEAIGFSTCPEAVIRTFTGG